MQLRDQRERVFISFLFQLAIKDQERRMITSGRISKHVL